MRGLSPLPCSIGGVKLSLHQSIDRQEGGSEVLRPKSSGVRTVAAIPQEEVAMAMDFIRLRALARIEFLCHAELSGSWSVVISSSSDFHIRDAFSTCNS